MSTLDRAVNSNGPSFLGGKMVTTAWNRSLGDRALGEELKPAVLSPIPATMATPLEAQLALSLGIEDSPQYPRLPLEVGACQQGPHCIWRWLARAALEEVAGEALGHLALPQAVAFLKDKMKDLDDLREWAKSAHEGLEELKRVELELKQLHRSHTEVHLEAQALHAKAEEAADMKNQVDRMQAELDTALRNCNEAQKLASRTKADMIILADGELAAAKNRAESAERLVAELIESREEARVAKNALEGQLRIAQDELLTEREELVKIKTELEKVSSRRGQRRRSVRAKAKAKGSRR